MMVLAEYASEEVIDGGARSTARVINFLGQLFDFPNVSQYFVSEKPLTCALQNNTEHIELWKKSLNILKSMFFIKDDSKFVPPTIKNWISIIESILFLWKHLNCEEDDCFSITKSLNILLDEKARRPSTSKADTIESVPRVILQQLDMKL